MKYGQGFKEIVNRQIPVGGCVADTAYLIAGEILVAVDTRAYAASTTAPFVKRGCVALPPKGGDVPAAGAPCYLDATTGAVQATSGAAVYLCGTRDATHPSDDGVALIGVDLDGTTAAVYGVPGDIQGVTAGTNLTGGGTSGTVTLNVDTTKVPGMAAIGGAGNLVQTAAADRALSDAGIAVADVPTMAAVGGAGNLIQTAAADRAQSDAGIAVADVPTMAWAAAGAGSVIVSAGADKSQAASATSLATVPTMAAVGGVGTFVQTAAADREQSDSGIAVADAVTQAAAAAGAGTIPQYAGASKVIVDSAVPMASVVAPARSADMAAYGATGAEAANPYIIFRDIAAAAVDINIFDGDCPTDLMIIDAWVNCTTALGGGTCTLHQGTVAVPGAAITNAMAMAVQDAVTHAGTIYTGNAQVAAAGSLMARKNALGDQGVLFILVVNV